MSEEKKEYKKTSIGGQALIEGVMMRGPKKTALAVRNKSGRICLEEWGNELKKPKVYKIPFVRGIFNFVGSMKVGYKTLMMSAEISEQEDKPQEQNNVEEDTVDNTVNVKNDTKQEESFWMNILMTLSSVLGMVLAIVLFIGVPTGLCNFLKKYVDILNNNVAQSVFEGVLKIIIFIGYISVISLWEDMRRVFMYHGAEHKTIFCYENGLELTVENVRKQKRFHPRCGTSFIILMLFIGIFVSMFIPNSIPTLYRTAIRLLCLPIIMGIGYEAIKLAGRKDNAFVKIISAPGLWVQRLSTKEPTDDMIECAIVAFNAVEADS